MRWLALLPLLSLVSCFDEDDAASVQTQDAPAAVGCGDGVCDGVEARSGRCAADCDGERVALGAAPVPTARAAAPRGGGQPLAYATADLSPLFVSVVVHAEEDTHGHKPKPQIPDYDGDPELMKHFTMVMREFVKLCERHGAKVNFGSDWTFADGVAAHDPGFFAELEASGHEIDAHAHESHVDYHAVRERIIKAGGHPTQVASGLLEDRIGDKMTEFDSLGSEFRILWGVGNANHSEGEVISGWAWRPGRTDWLVHDPGSPYLVIGSGVMKAELPIVQEAIQQRQAGRLDTYSVFVTPRWFLAERGAPGIPERWTADKTSPDYWENRLATWEAFFQGMDAHVQQGTVRYATLTEIAELFEQREPEIAPAANMVHPRTSRRGGGDGAAGQRPPGKGKGGQRGGQRNRR
jgi:hypothetical protein